MKSEFLSGKVVLHQGDARDVLGELPEDHFHACVTDPPYALVSEKRSVRDRLSKLPGDRRTFSERGFMGQRWDNSAAAHDVAFWREVFRVLKPGAHLVAFGGTRTYHRMVCAIEDAGFEIRDTLMWLYGSGFPKSHDVSKGIDRRGGNPHLAREIGLAIKAAREKRGLFIAECDSKFESTHWHLFESGHRFPPKATFSKIVDAWPELASLADAIDEINREVIGNGNNFLAQGQFNARSIGNGGYGYNNEYDLTAPATDAAREWAGWGTALKPAYENIICAQKPYNLLMLCETVVRKLMEAICLLPSLASAAENNSALSQSVFVAGFGSAQWNAVLGCNTPAVLFALMDTLPSELATPSSLNTALLWLSILVEVSTRASMFTIETVTSLITDLQTLNCLLSKNTANCIIEAAIHRLGIGQNACIAEDIFSAVAIRLKITSTLSVRENATGLDVASCPAEGAQFKPDVSPIVLARKPLSEGTVAANVLRWGCGALNVDGCRIEGEPVTIGMSLAHRGNNYGRGEGGRGTAEQYVNTKGRWPANVVHDGSEEVLARFPDCVVGGDSRSAGGQNGKYSPIGAQPDFRPGYGGDTGSTARFFYSAKADSDERIGSKHPTVKPLDLMQWLVRLVTPKAGLVLDPFAGSGTTGEAAWREGMRAVLIEKEEAYCADIARRMALALSGPIERMGEIVKAKGKEIDLGPLFGGRAS